MWLQLLHVALSSGLVRGGDLVWSLPSCASGHEIWVGSFAL